MPAEDNPRSNFVFAPPQDNPAAWQASLQTFRDALARDFPDAFLETNTSSLRDTPVLDFEVEVAPDVFVTGTAAMPAPDYAHVSVIDATAGEAAVFAQWLRDSYVSSPTSVRFLSSFVMENGDETPWPLPATGDAAAIEAVLRGHLAAAGAECPGLPHGHPAPARLQRAASRLTGRGAAPSLPQPWPEARAPSESHR